MTTSGHGCRNGTEIGTAIRTGTTGTVGIKAVVTIAEMTDEIGDHGVGARKVPWTRWIPPRTRISRGEPGPVGWRWRPPNRRRRTSRRRRRKSESRRDRRRTTTVATSTRC
uniref:(northern house mosquito) hypothetical protein n=1 Tax=Culex pipiens TaxID=7175 RepID=A0A8D8KJA2_CULPI